MNAAFVLLLVIMAGSALEPLWPESLAEPVDLILSGIGLLLALLAIPPGEGAHFRKMFFCALPVGAIVFVWVLIQLAPLPFAANPVWASAANALGTKLLGHITVDLGATVVALGNVILLFATSALAAAVTVDRDRAEITLPALALAGAAYSLIGFVVSKGNAGPYIGGAVASLSWTAAAMYLALERFETRHARQTRPGSRLAASATLCGIIAAFDAGMLVRQADPPVFFAAIVGASLLGGIVAIRRSGIGKWTAAVTAMLLVSGAGLIVAANTPVAVSPLLAFTNAATSVQELTQRILADVPLAGTGLGTAAIMIGPYRGFDDPPTTSIPSLALTLMIEIGWPSALFCLLASAAAVTYFTRNALARGRDSVYDAAGASVLLALTILAFVDCGPGIRGLSLLVAASTGLALAQAEGRRM